jgi:hypothetical protein
MEGRSNCKEVFWELAKRGQRSPPWVDCGSTQLISMSCGASYA